MLTALLFILLPMFTPQTDEEFVAWLMVFILGMIICANLDVILIGLTIYGIYSAVKATAIIILVLLLIGIIILIEKNTSKKKPDNKAPAVL